MTGSVSTISIAAVLDILDLRGLADIPAIPRAQIDTDEARTRVREIVQAVRDGGAAEALRIQSEVGVTPQVLRVDRAACQQALDALEPTLRDALHVAATRIRAYHERQFAEGASGSWRMGEPGATVGERIDALQRAGCYAPGGRASYPSSVLMTVIPARVAGVRDVIVACPPASDGHIHPATLAAAAIAGADQVIALGGAQAIAALAYGIEDIAPVDVIVGPGNLWVTLAKMEVAHRVRVDGFQGPTEIVIIADKTMPALFAAADLVAQAEHDPLATCLLITPDETLANDVLTALAGEVAAHPRALEVEAALRDHGRIILVDDLEHACRVSDTFAPEHLELAVAAPERLLPRITHAGAIFCGPYAPVSLGDYLAGTNHVLPTAGSARFTSPLGVETFLRRSGIIAFGPGGLARVAPALMTLAEAEGLVAHGRAVQVRLDAER